MAVESCQQVGRQPADHVLGGEAFEGATDLERLGDGVGGQLRDEGAAAGTDLDQSFGGQPGDGVLDRRGAHAELVGERADVEAVARSEPAAQDVLPQDVEHRVAGSGARESRKGLHDRAGGSGA